MCFGFGQQSREEKKIQAFMKLFEKMEKNEVGGKAIGSSHTGKEVKKRKRSVEKESIGDGATSTGSTDQKLVADVPLPSPVADAKLSEMSADEAVEVKRDGVESSMEDVFTAEAVVSSCADVDTAEENSQSYIVDIADNTTNDVPAAEVAVDVKVQSPCVIPESCPTPNESLTKPIMQASMADTKRPVETPCMKVDADDADAVAVTDEPATAAVKTVQDMVELPEQIPETELTKHESDTAHVEDTVKVELPERIPTVEPTKLESDTGHVEDTTVSAVTEESKPMTATVMQTDASAETVDEVTKTGVTSETKSAVVKGSLKPRSTAKLKFGMYARRPLASRMLVRAVEQETKSDSESDDEDEDTAAKSTSESETATKSKRGRPVKFLWYFHQSAMFCYSMNVAVSAITSKKNSL